MKNKIDKLIALGLKDRAAFDKKVDLLSKKAKTNTAFKEQLGKEFDESLARKGQEIKELSVRAQLANISEVISLSYVARHYFKKSRQWLMQRINGYTVNGKKARFTPEQITTLNKALQDISKRIGSVNVIH